MSGLAKLGILPRIAKRLASTGRASDAQMKGEKAMQLPPPLPHKQKSKSSRNFPCYSPDFRGKKNARLFEGRALKPHGAELDMGFYGGRKGQDVERVSSDKRFFEQVIHNCALYASSFVPNPRAEIPRPPRRIFNPRSYGQLKGVEFAIFAGSSITNFIRCY